MEGITEVFDLDRLGKKKHTGKRHSIIFEHSLKQKTKGTKKVGRERVPK